MGASEDRDITNHIAIYGFHPDEEFIMCNNAPVYCESCDEELWALSVEHLCPMCNTVVGETP